MGTLLRHARRDCVKRSWVGGGGKSGKAARPEYGMRLLMVAISDSELRLLLLLGAEFFILCDDTLIG